MESPFSMLILMFETAVFSVQASKMGSKETGSCVH